MCNSQAIMSLPLIMHELSSWAGDASSATRISTLAKIKLHELSTQ